MAAFTFVHYDPKPSKTGLQKPSSKFTKNLAIDSSSVPVEVLPALEGAAGDNNWCQKVVEDSVTTVQDAQACRGDLVGTQVSIAEKDWFDINIDNEFPSLARLLSSNYKLESVEERPSVESTAGKGNDQALDNSLLGSRGSRAGSTYNEPILLHSDDELEDDNNLDPGHARCIVEGGQPGCDTFDMEHPPMLSTHRPTSMERVVMASIKPCLIRLLNDGGPTLFPPPPPDAILARHCLLVKKMRKAVGNLLVTAIPKSQEPTISTPNGGRFPLHKAAG